MNKLVNGVMVEMTQAEIDAITQSPADILSQKRNELIARQKTELDANALDIASAVAEDGANETANIEALRANRLAIKNQFRADMIALITGDN